MGVLLTTAIFGKSVFTEIAKITLEQIKPTIELMLLNLFINGKYQCKQGILINFLSISKKEI